MPLQAPFVNLLCQVQNALTDIELCKILRMPALLVKIHRAVCEPEPLEQQDSTINLRVGAGLP